LAKALSDREGALAFSAGTLTVGEWMERWLEDCLRPLLEASKMVHSTFVRYEGITNNHLKPTLGNRKLKNLTRAEVRRLYAEKSKTLSPRSVDYIHTTLQKALAQAVIDHLIPSNVASGERPRSNRNCEEAMALSPIQARALLTAADGERNEGLYVVALHTGLRQGELLGLKWEDVDLQRTKPVAGRCPSTGAPWPLSKSTGCDRTRRGYGLANSGRIKTSYSPTVWASR
jgi:integrase